MLSIRIDPLITITVLGRMNQLHGWEHNGKKNQENVLVVVIKGSCVFQWPDNRYELETGDVLVIPAQTLYHAYTESECEYYFFHFQTAEPIQIKPETALPALTSPIQAANGLNFDIRQRQGIDPGLVYVEYKTQLSEYYKDVLFLISKAFDKLNNMGRYDSPFIRLYFTEILLLLDLQLHQQHQQQVKPYPAQLANMISFINQNYTQPLSLQQLSDNFQLSKQYIARLFIRYLNVTANTYILMVKLHHAQELLKFSRMNITEISNHLGFCSTSYFSRVFKQYYAISPKQYQYSSNKLIQNSSKTLLPDGEAAESGGGARQ